MWTVHIQVGCSHLFPQKFSAISKLFPASCKLREFSVILQGCTGQENHALPHLMNFVSSSVSCVFNRSYGKHFALEVGDLLIHQPLFYHDIGSGEN